jgi:hypothetical protein
LIGTTLTECKYISRLLIELTIVLVQFSEAIFNCPVVDLKAGQIELGFPGTL